MTEGPFYQHVNSCGTPPVLETLDHQTLQSIRPTLIAILEHPDMNNDEHEHHHPPYHMVREARVLLPELAPLITYRCGLPRCCRSSHARRYTRGRAVSPPAPFLWEEKVGSRQASVHKRYTLGTRPEEQIP